MKDLELKKIDKSMLLDEIKRRLDNPSILNFTDEELKKALKNRGFHVFDEDPTDEDIDLDEVDLADIVEHVKGCGYTVFESNKVADFISDLPSYKLKDLLCDVVGVNHHTAKENIMKLLSEKF